MQGTLRLPALIGSIVLGAAMLVGQARADIITLCNHGDNTIEYVKIQNTGLYLFAPSWTARGWYKISPGECENAVVSEGRNELYLSIRDVTPNGARLHRYPVESGTLHKAGSQGMEKPFCVKASGAFTRREKTLDAHTRCPDGYSLLLFNVFAFAGPRNDFTLHLD